MSYIGCFLIGFFLAAFFTMLVFSCLEVNRIADYEAEITYLKMKINEKDETDGKQSFSE